MNGKNIKAFAVLRIAFGLVWAVDAWFKWQPGFIHGFTTYFTSMVQGQPAFVQAWLNFWISIVNVNPHLFAILTACAETAIALMLIFGLFTDIALWASIVLAALIWATVEAFGGPYVAGSTDIGAGIMYVFVAAALIFGESSRAYSIDGILRKK